MSIIIIELAPRMVCGFLPRAAGAPFESFWGRVASPWGPRGPCEPPLGVFSTIRWEASMKQTPPPSRFQFRPRQPAHTDFVPMSGMSPPLFSTPHRVGRHLGQPPRPVFDPIQPEFDHPIRIWAANPPGFRPAPARISTTPPGLGQPTHPVFGPPPPGFGQPTHPVFDCIKFFAAFFSTAFFCVFRRAIFWPNPPGFGFLRPNDRPACDTGIWHWRPNPPGFGKPCFSVGQMEKTVGEIGKNRLGEPGSPTHPVFGTGGGW